MVRTLNSHGLISNLVTGGFEPISTYVGEKLGFHNVISNQFVFDKNNCFTGEYHLVNGEKIQNINLWKNYQRKRI